MPEPGVTENTISITESLEQLPVSCGSELRRTPVDADESTVRRVYITGSHAFKTGLFVLQEWRRQTDDPNWVSPISSEMGAPRN